MKKLETVMVVSIILSAVGVVCFWVFGYNKAETLAAWSITIAGICGYIFLGCLWLRHCRQSWTA